MSMRTSIAMVAVGLALVACQTTKDASNLATLGVDFQFEGKHGCVSTPPAFTVSNIPTGTKTLKFWMTDLDKPGYPHGGGTVAYSGSGNIPEGAFSYTGPCPPSVHKYEFEVTAINAAGDTVLGRGKATRPFPPN